MAVIIKQKSRYLRRASLCYDAALPLQGDKAAEMVRLANIYADLADTLRDEKESENPNCTLCGLRMAPKRVLHATEVFPARLIFQCACGESLTCRKHGREAGSPVRATPLMTSVPSARR
jgi:hypothetical protein